MKGFKQAAERTPEQMHDILAGRFRDMMTELSIVSEKQNAFISERQVVMKAIAVAVRDHDIAPPESLIGQNGQPDLLRLASMDDSDLLQLLDQTGLTNERLERARESVEGDYGLNMDPVPWQVPMIGKIQGYLLDRPDVIEAMVTLQQAVRASDVLYRLQQGTPDKDNFETRREFSHIDSNEDQRLRDAVNFHFEVAMIENDEAQPGVPYDITPFKDQLRQVFHDGLSMFANSAGGAGRNTPSPFLIALEDSLTSMAHYCLNRVNALQPLLFDTESRLSSGDPDPLTDPNFEIPAFLQTGPNRGDRDLDR